MTTKRVPVEIAVTSVVNGGEYFIRTLVRTNDNKLFSINGDISGVYGEWQQLSELPQPEVVKEQVVVSKANEKCIYEKCSDLKYKDENFCSYHSGICTNYNCDKKLLDGFIVCIEHLDN